MRPKAVNQPASAETATVGPDKLEQWRDAPAIDETGEASLEQVQQWGDSDETPKGDRTVVADI